MRFASYETSHLKLPAVAHRSDRSRQVPNYSNNFNSVLSESGFTADTFHKLELLSERPFMKKHVTLPAISESTLHAANPNVNNSNSTNTASSSDFDDFILKKALSEAFEEDPNSYLGSLKDATVKYANTSSVGPSIPKTLIPKEYFIYTKSPFHQGLGKLTSDDEVTFNEETNEWQKLIFPSYKPVRRAEVFLLAKTLDDMLEHLKKEEMLASSFVFFYSSFQIYSQPILLIREEEFHNLALDRLTKSFKAHVSALFEIARQIFVTCVERAILLQKIYFYFLQYFDQTISVIHRERKKCADFQDIITEYEKLIQDLGQEKERARVEMENLLKENNELFKDKEEFRLKAANAPKYELVLKLLKNKKTWENFLKETNQDNSSTHKALTDLGKSDEQLGLRIGREQADDDSDLDISEEDDKVFFDALVGHPRAQSPKEDKTTKKMVYLIGTNMAETFSAVSDLSRVTQKQFNFRFSTQLDRDKFSGTQPNLQLILSGLYDITSRIADITTLFRERRLPIETRDADVDVDVDSDQEDAESHIKVEFEQSDGHIGVQFHEVGSSTIDLLDEEETGLSIDHEVFALRSDQKFNKRLIEAKDTEIYKKDILLNQRKAQYDQERRNWAIESQGYREQIESLQRRLAELESGQSQPINLVINVTDQRKRKNVRYSGSGERQDDQLSMYSDQTMEDADINTTLDIGGDYKQSIQQEGDNTAPLQRKDQHENNSDSNNEEVSSNDPTDERSHSSMSEDAQNSDAQLSINTPKTSRPKTTDDSKQTGYKDQRNTNTNTNNTANDVKERSQTYGDHEFTIPDINNNSGASTGKQKRVDDGTTCNTAGNSGRGKETQMNQSPSNSSSNSNNNNNNKDSNNSGRRYTGSSRNVLEIHTSRSSGNKNSSPRRQNSKHDNIGADNSPTSPTPRDKYRMMKDPRFEDVVGTPDHSDSPGVKVKKSRILTMDIGVQVGSPTVKRGSTMYDMTAHLTRKASRIVRSAPSTDEFGREISDDTTTKERTDTAEDRHNSPRIRQIGYTSTRAFRFSSKKLVHRTKNERLLQIIQRMKMKGADSKPKSLLWLLRLITNLYKGKIHMDHMDERFSRTSIPEYFFEHLKQIYGTAKLVDEYAGSVVATITKYKEIDVRVECFGKLLYEEWSLKVATFFLRVWKLFEESKAGPEYSNRPGDDLPKQQIVSKVRCLYILNTLKNDIPGIIEQIVSSIEDKCVVVSDVEFMKAMNLAGYKVSGLNSFSPMDNWGVDYTTAKQVLRKADFLEAVAEVFANTEEMDPYVSQENTARDLLVPTDNIGVE